MPHSPVGDLNFITVHGKFVDYLGSPISGSLTFTPSTTLQDPASDTLLVPLQFSVALDGAGAFSIDLPATDDPDINPTGWTYAVSENFTGNKGRSYSISVPVSSPSSSVSLASLAPATASSPGFVNYVLVADFNTRLAAATGAPVGAAGATLATRYVGRWAATGAPAAGSFLVGDFGFDGANTELICTVAGSPGTWVHTGSAASGGSGFAVTGATDGVSMTLSYTATTWGISVTTGCPYYNDANVTAGDEAIFTVGSDGSLALVQL